VVQEPGRRPTGYVVRDGKASTWEAEARGPAGGGPRRLRIALGGGWMHVGGAHYGDFGLAADLQLVGPLHLHVEGDVGLSQPIEFPDHGLDGSFTVLPGFGAGVSMRPGGDVVQPFAALSFGVWIVPATYTDKAREAVSQLGDVESRAAVESRSPVTFRAFLDGGVDLAPTGPLIVRLSGGIGYGFGFQARAGAAVGLRFGKGGTP